MISTDRPMRLRPCSMAASAVSPAIGKAAACARVTDGSSSARAFVGTATRSAQAYPDMPAPTDDYLALVLDADLRLLDLTERLRQHWAAHAAALSLTAAQVKVLLRLTPGEASPMRKLAQQLDYDASNLTTLVDRLAQRGVLERQADPTDRRVKALLLTPKGERLRDLFWHNLVTDPGPLTPLRDGDLRTLTRILAKLDQPTG